jgi:hypothetical protein
MREMLDDQLTPNARADQNSADPMRRGRRRARVFWPWIAPIVGALLAPALGAEPPEPVELWQRSLAAQRFIPLLAGLGFMGMTGIALRVGTSIILPTSLGIAVDTTTHYLTRAREEWERTRDHPTAVQRALVGTGWGIVSSTLVLVVGFLAYHVPPFLAFNQGGFSRASR